MTAGVPYSKTTWVNDTAPFINATALNKMEQGIQDGDPTTRPVIARSVLATGLANQTRAGRQLAVADFTAMGLSTPVGLFNLGSTANLGSGGALTNKGTVTFAAGITGAGSEAAQFTGSTAQALYIADIGTNDPFRIRTGSFACWFRTAKRGTNHVLMTKLGSTAGTYSWELWVEASNIVRAYVSVDGTVLTSAFGVSDVADDRWHFAVAAYDGSALTLTIDGTREATVMSGGGAINASGGFAMTIGGRAADSSGTTIVLPFNGRVDEAFVTPDVLTLDQIRMLYAVKVTHTLTVAPREADVTIDRYRRGVALVSGDFPTAPKVLYNFTAGALTSAGTLANTLTNNNAAVSVAGVDGLASGAFQFNGTTQYLSGVDTGLPFTTTSRSLGAWIRTTALNLTSDIISYGTAVAGGYMSLRITAGGSIGLSDGSATTFATAPFNITQDGAWHFVVATYDAQTTPPDGLRYKVYVDGALVASDTQAMGGSTATGTFNIGRRTTAAQYWAGGIDAAFITDYVLTADQIMSLYAKGAQQLLSSPKNVGDHIEGIDAITVYVIGDMLEPQDKINIGVTV